MTTLGRTACVGGLLLFHALALMAAEPKFPHYTGQNVCRECHTQDHGPMACGLEPIPEHVRSYGALSKTKAETIAALSGIGVDPHESRICLSCHATSADEGPRWRGESFDIADGVQCEACHGPGSLHAAWYCSDDNGVGFARRRLTIPTRDACSTCHMPRLSHRLVLDQGFRTSPVDGTYKTPVNLVVSNDGRRLYVVCQQSDSVIVVDPQAGEVLDEIAVGHHPHGATLSPDGGKLFVTNRLSGNVSVIDTPSAKVITEFPVGSEPHGVLTNASGSRLYVLNTGENTVSVVDTSGFGEIKRLSTGQGPWSMAMDTTEKRIYVTAVRPRLADFLTSPVSEVSVIDTENDIISDRLEFQDANMMQGVAAVPNRRIMLTTLMRTKSLVPITRLAQGWTITSGLGVVWPDGRVDQVLLDEPNNHFPDPADLAVAPDGRFALVAGGGCDEVAVVDIAKLVDVISSADSYTRENVLPNHLGMSQRFVVKRVKVGRNPRGLVFSPDGRFAYVANALDDSVSVIETSGFSVVRTIPLGGPRVITEIRKGERLFHSADITFGRQFSCRSCHPDGHINGLTMDIEADGIGMHPVDNRTLRGILDTSPFKWEGTNPSLERQCGPRLSVFFTRIDPFTPKDLTALVHYMCTIPRPPNRYRSAEGLTLAQRRGKAVFERSRTHDGREIPIESRCSTCHSGAYKTSRRIGSVGTTLWLDGYVEAAVEDLHAIEEYGYLGIVYFHDTGTATKRFDVPHLVNIHNSPPYLHNGAAKTLQEIWTRFNLYDEHGVTGDLTRGEFNDLITYLKAL
jgi:YVTN family beta-propeller protein